MKTTRKSFGAASALLVASILALPPLTAQIAWTGVGTYTQDFSTFNGTEASLPAGFFAEAAESPLPFVPGGSGGTVDGTNSTTGFRTFRLSTSPVDPNKRWFGIFEGSALSDSRLFAEIENTSGSPITALRVRYRTSIWRDGNRENSIRIKYNNSTGGFSSVPDSDVWVAKVNATGNVAYDGNASAYSDQRDVIITLPTPLANNSTGYLRWQYSTNSGSGSRDGLGITDIQIDAISEGTPLSWDGGSGGWSDENWAGDAWVTGRKATFAGTGSTLNVDDDFVVNGIQFNSTGWALADNGGVLVLAGSVTIGNAGHTATINADIEGVDLVKNGAGTLVLGGDADLSGDLKIFAGTVRIGSTFSISNTARVDLGNNTTLDLDGNNLTVRGLTGAASGTVDIDGATLTLDQGGSNVSYRGAIVGAGSLVKTGVGLQEFQTTPKTYTGNTSVDQGTLALTINGLPTHTAGVFVYGPETAADPSGYGELLLNRAGTYLIGSSLGSAPSITLDGGWLASDTNLSVTLQNPLVLVVPTGVDDDAQGRPDLGNQIYARGATGLLQLNGAITGSGGFRKQAQGELVLANAGNTYSGGTNLRRGTLTVPATGSLGSGPLLFTNDEETRTLQLGADATVSLLDGESPDPATPGNANNAFLVIASGKTLTVDQAADVFFDSDLNEWVENRTRFQGDITGAGHFVKAGKGYLSFSRYAKTLTGSVSIDEGVLDVSAPAALANVSLIDVAQGGQLRLATNGTGVAYAFGGPLHLGSTQRATGGDLQDDHGFGILGGLRYDPAAGTHSATLSSPVVITADADIHVNGADKTLTLSGALSSAGSYELFRTGGGKLVLAAGSTGFNGTLTLLNGATVINTTLGNTTTPVSVIVSSTSGAAAPASLSGTGTVNGDVSYEAGSAIVVAASTPVLTINGDLDLGTAVIDTTGVSTGNYDLFTVTGAKSFGSVSIVGGGSISVSGNTVRLVK